MGTTAKASGGDFPKAPMGTHVARCFQVIDLGHQKITWQGKEKWQPKIMLTWELLGDERMEDGKPFAISNRYTLSLAETSQLRPMLEAWRGKQFSEEELNGFDIKNVLGAYCMLTVMHNQKDGRTYANVGGVVALPKGMPKPQAVNPPLYFNLDDCDPSVLPEWIRGIVEKSREMTESNGHDPMEAINGMDSDIPFDNPYRGIRCYVV